MWRCFGSFKALGRHKVRVGAKAVDAERGVEEEEGLVCCPLPISEHRMQGNLR